MLSHCSHKKKNHTEGKRNLINICGQDESRDSCFIIISSLDEQNFNSWCPCMNLSSNQWQILTSSSSAFDSLFKSVNLISQLYFHFTTLTASAQYAACISYQFLRHMSNNWGMCIYCSSECTFRYQLWEIWFGWMTFIITYFPQNSTNCLDIKEWLMAIVYFILLLLPSFFVLRAIQIYKM